MRRWRVFKRFSYARSIIGNIRYFDEKVSRKDLENQMDAYCVAHKMLIILGDKKKYLLDLEKDV